MSTHVTQTTQKTTRLPTDLVRGYPSLSRSADIIGVNKATLSRLQLNTEGAGNQARLPAATVIELAARYRRRDLHAVAFDLVAHAEQTAPDLVEAIEAEIDHALQQTRKPRDHQQVDLQAFLIAAERLLPAEMYEQVKEAAEHTA